MYRFRPHIRSHSKRLERGFVNRALVRLSFGVNKPSNHRRRRTSGSVPPAGGLRRRTKSLAAACALSLIPVAPVVLTAAQPAGAAVTVTDLGTLGGTFAEALAENSHGQIVGQSTTASGAYQAFSWTASGGMVDLGDLLGALQSIALAVNDSGQVLVDVYCVSCANQYAYLWTPGGGFDNIGTLDGNPKDWVYATGLNDLGQVVGYTYLGNVGFPHGFSWTANSGMIDLNRSYCGASNAAAVSDGGQVALELQACPSPPQRAAVWTASNGTTDLGTLGGQFGSSDGVNSSGQIVGASSTAGGDFHGFSWTPSSGLVDIGTLGGSYSNAVGVNEDGQVVGVSSTASGASHAFLWSSNGGMTDLGTLGGSFSNWYGFANGDNVINDAGHIVGYSATASGDDHAFYWTQSGGMIDLGTLGGSFSFASEVTDSDQVLGAASLPDGSTHAVVWQVATPDSDLSIGPAPADIVTAATGPGGTVVSYTPPTATDESGETPPVSCDTPSGSTFPIGTTTVTCTASDSDDTPSSVSTSFTVTVTKAAQSIMFPAIPLHLLDAKNTPTSEPITATASSGLEVTVTSSTPSVCNVANPTLSGGVTTWTLTVTAVGTCALSSSQVGNGTYLAAPAVTQSFQVARLLSMGPQAMEGDLKVAGGSTLKAGYDFTIPGQHPADSVSFVGANVVFAYTCTSGSNSGTFSVPIPDATISDPAGSPSWYPSGSQSDPSVYQGAISVPNVCPTGALVRLQKGGTFSTGVASSGTDTINVRWHYSANGGSGSWSGTSAVVPA